MIQKVRMRASAITVLAAVTVVAGLVGWLVPFGSGDAEPREHSITVRARQYAYDPPVIRVRRGDVLHLRFVSEDVVHGFYLEGHDLDLEIHPMSSAVEVRKPSDPDFHEEMEEVTVRANRSGKFRYRCSHTCGTMHPFMLGELIVGPNRLLHAGIGLVMGLLLGGVVYVRMTGEPKCHDPSKA